VFADHVFTSGHETFVDDLGRVVSASVDMNAFLDDRVAACSQRLSRLVPTWLHLRLCLRCLHPGAAVRGHDGILEASGDAQDQGALAVIWNRGLFVEPGVNACSRLRLMRRASCQETEMDQCDVCAIACVDRVDIWRREHHALCDVWLWRVLNRVLSIAR